VAPYHHRSISASNDLARDLVPGLKKNEQHAVDPKIVTFSWVDFDVMEDDPAKRNHYEQGAFQHSSCPWVPFQVCKRGVDEKNGIDKSSYEDREI
jgi:hypothetical protein